MSQDFAFNARQYYDFTKFQEEDNPESYFEEQIRDEVFENHVTSSGIVEENVPVELSDPEEDMEFFSPMKSMDSSATAHLRSQMRRSLSVNDVGVLHYSRDSDDYKQEEDPLSDDVNSMCLNELRKVESTWSLDKHSYKHKTSSKENLNRLAQPKKRYNSQETLSKQSDFVSLAEAVTRFQKGTPVRFRSRPAPQPTRKPLFFGRTKPESPKLTAKNRSRPAHLMTREEQEKLEFEEAQKFKIKALPVNKRVLKGPVKAEISRKPSTVVEPFKLTAVPKKVEPPKEVFQFHARPAPKSIKSPFKVVESRKAVTVPVTPQCAKNIPKVAPKKKVADSPNKPWKSTKTTLHPFSFESRDIQLMKKREEFVKKVIEEEKKAREFHANPVPKKILQARTNSFDSSDSSASSRMKSHEEPVGPVFKARPATVLKMAPFEPKKDESHVLEIEEFHLFTDDRAKERREFERKRKEKEDMIEFIKQHKEQERLQQEEAERARLRKEAEVKAQPIRKYKEVKIIPANKVTQPISPNFATDRIRNKENIANNGDVQ